jgi:hypothetical protein
MNGSEGCGYSYVGVAARKCGTSLKAKRMVMFGERKPMMWKGFSTCRSFDIGRQSPIKMSSYHKPDAEIRPCVVPKRETSNTNGSKSRCLACRITVALATRLIKVNQSRHVNWARCSRLRVAIGSMTMRWVRDRISNVMRQNNALS